MILTNNLGDGQKKSNEKGVEPPEEPTNIGKSTKKSEKARKKPKKMNGRPVQRNKTRPEQEQ